MARKTISLDEKDHCFSVFEKRGGLRVKLSENDGKRFYDLWLPLLDHVNEKRGVNSTLRDIQLADYLYSNEVKEVSDVLWADVDLIDEYLNCTEDITDHDRELISSTHDPGDAYTI